MKYKVYGKKNTIEKYKLKRNLFNKKYVVKIFYTDSVFTEKVEMNTLEEIKDYEKYILDIMNSQLIKLVNDNELKQKELNRVVNQKMDNRKLIMDNLAVLIPILMMYLLKNSSNFILYFPIKIMNIVFSKKYRQEIVEQIEEDMLKYYIYSICIDDFNNYSKYITPSKMTITANNIDHYSLEQLQNYRKELLDLKSKEEILQKKKIFKNSNGGII